MEFSRKEVLQVIIATLIEAQEDLSVEAIEIVEDTKPIGDLSYFDSLASVMVTIRCLDVLGYEDELSMPTLFVDKQGKYLTVGEVADHILKLLKKKNRNASHE